MSSERREKRKKKNKLIFLLGIIAIILLVLIAMVVVQLARKQENPQTDMNSNMNQNSEQKAWDVFYDFFNKNKEVEWIIEGEPVSKELMYGYYLPMHCSDTQIANVDVVLNMFEEKEWSTYISQTGNVLTLSAVPLLWDGSRVELSLVSTQNMDSLKEETGYLHGLAGERSYKEMIRTLYSDYGFTTVTFYDERRNLYTIDCAYTIEGNDMKLVMIHYDQEKREYSLVPMENYQVIREANKITIYKDKNFVTYVPYNLCENASAFRIEAFSNRKDRRYENIAGFTYNNLEPMAEDWPLYGCVYFADGTKASKAVFDFSKENQLAIRWENRETDYFGTIVEIEGAGEVTFSYKIVQDTGLILEKDGVEYYYLKKMNE